MKWQKNTNKLFFEDIVMEGEGIGGFDGFMLMTKMWLANWLPQGPIL